MEREQTIRVIPENSESMISVFAEKEELLTTVNELKYLPFYEYEGPTEITPSEETQVLRTTDFVVPVDIIVNPIPSNYGLITWNGRGIRIS